MQEAGMEHTSKCNKLRAAKYEQAYFCAANGKLLSPTLAFAKVSLGTWCRAGRKQAAHAPMALRQCNAMHGDALTAYQAGI